MFFRTLHIFFFLASLTLAAHAQINPAPMTAADKDSRHRAEPPERGSPLQEMLGKALIRSEENAHKEALERAREGAQLGLELQTTFKNVKAFNRDDLKKLERVEKLARAVRKHAGGSDDDDPNLEDPPRSLEAAIARLVETAEDLSKSVEKTSRHVVSANVIERSNDLIELVRLIRAIAQ